VSRFASFALAFALQLRKKHGKTSVRLVRHKHKIITFPLETRLQDSALALYYTYIVCLSCSIRMEVETA
jgi:hypothetical protein